MLGPIRASQPVLTLPLARSPVIQRLGKRLLLRQRPIATSIVYFRRFYLKNALCETDPYLVLATCAYVAAKLEETPVHIKSVVIEARQMFSGAWLSRGGRR